MSPSRQLLAFLAVLSLSSPLAAVGMPYLQAEVDIRKMGDDAYSAGTVLCYNWLGSQTLSCTISGTHWIEDDATSMDLASKSIATTMEYSGWVRGYAEPDTCYRARIIGSAQGFSVDEGYSGTLACGPPTQEAPPPYTAGCEYNRCSPIVLDLGAGGFRFTSLEDGVSFDLDADGAADSIAWTDPSAREAFLVLDRNGNGEVDDGRELFGGVTDQPATEDPNGFAALKVFDERARGGDGDGWISASDAVFARLRLWIDANHDGRSQRAEMSSLDAEGVVALDLDPVVSHRRDRYGNQLRWAGHVRFAQGRRLAAVDVLFLMD